MSPDETLAQEARRRPRAAAAAFAAALLILGSYIVAGAAFRDRPSASVLDALGQAARPGPVGGAQSLQVPALEFYSDRIVALVGSGVVRGLAYVLVGFALSALAAATRARSQSFPRFATLLPMVGGVLYGVFVALGPIGSAADVRRFLDGPRTVDSAAEIGEGWLSVAAGIVGLPGTLAIALAFVLVSLNAMRAGLLTRFMGVLGMLAGALFVIPLSGDLPVVQTFWLGALGVLLLGRWPGGAPPAWQTGRAEPWPTQQELREARDRDRDRGSAGRGKGGKGGAGGGGEREAADERRPVAAVAAGAHPASNKKKRKRRS